MTEKQLHKQICDYIKLQYPDVLFNTDMSGIKLTIGQAMQAAKLRSSRAFPDIVIYEPNDIYYGLFLEVKRDIPFKLDGFLKKCDHLKEQIDMITILINKGYYASFVWAFDYAKEIIDAYMNNKTIPLKYKN